MVSEFKATALGPEDDGSGWLQKPVPAEKVRVMARLFAVLTGPPGGETVQTESVGEEGRPQRSTVPFCLLCHAHQGIPGITGGCKACIADGFGPQPPGPCCSISFSLLSFVKTKGYLHIPGCVPCLSYSHSMETWALAFLTRGQSTWSLQFSKAHPLCFHLLRG